MAKSLCVPGDGWALEGFKIKASSEDIKKSSGKTEVPRVDVWIRAHTKKDGQPVNIQAGETIDKLKETLQDPSRHSSNNLRDDALSQVLRPDNSHLTAIGKGVTISKLAILSQMESIIAKLTKEHDEIKKENAQMKQEQDEMKKALSDMRSLVESHFHETETNGNPPKTPLTSPMSVKAIPNITKCKMLDLEGSDTVVAEGRWSSSDPNALVHHIPLGSNAIRVWVDIARQPLKFLWKVTPI
ncbi:hypothetical protein WN944_013493 [Citrus x changshan-huyou]|uniref:Uncharacterized protein n=1 Tax=Citrus x changshan-huyou TaxID=2935761 RepID=A0AAP0M454_9ROSI